MTFSPGQPCWIDLQVRDAPQREALMAFFNGAFGWEGEVGPPETGYYTRMYKDGQVTGAIGQIDQGGMVWVTYLHTDDIVATAARVAELGGMVVAGPMDVMTFGRLAIAVDPTGAVFGLWQPGEFAGFAQAIAPGHAAWFDQGSADPATATAFYRDVFGLDVHGDPDGGAMLGRGDTFWFSVSRGVEGQPADWKPVIMVPSLGALEEYVVASGGEVLAAGMEVPGGHATTFADPIAGAPLIAFTADGQMG